MAWSENVGVKQGLANLSNYPPLKNLCQRGCGPVAENRQPGLPAGHNPVGVESPHCRYPGLSLRSNPGLCYTTALRLKARSSYVHDRLA